jgi:hypothetical protein
MSGLCEHNSEEKVRPFVIAAISNDGSAQKKRPAFAGRLMIAATIDQRWLL